MIFFVDYQIFVLLKKLCGKTIPPQLVIITYHPVKTAYRKKFEKQMKTLTKIGNPVSLDDNLSMLENGINIAITFDDAYQSIIQNALPFMRAQGIPATIFVPTGYLGNRPGWITNIEHPYSNEIIITEEQLKYLPGNLVTIGSHTVSHINLTNVEKSIARREIIESKKTLEKMLGRNVTLFAAPYATLNEKFADLFKEAGYRRVFLNIPTFPATNTTPYILGRTSVEPTDWPIEYYLKLKAAYQWLPLAISLKKKFIK